LRGRPNFKDASDLSRGQKCTALLPIFLARRDNPLIIDQPEDNLDNHFIFETVVNAVQRMKRRRQMIFITHNANIPVLRNLFRAWRGSSTASRRSPS
jgi:ABC-type cobalamin/Fe3+-siderophores transport system ATPase subunit